jgi:hypothetical protein
MAGFRANFTILFSYYFCYFLSFPFIADYFIYCVLTLFTLFSFYILPLFLSSHFQALLKFSVSNFILAVYCHFNFLYIIPYVIYFLLNVLLSYREDRGIRIARIFGTYLPHYMPLFQDVLNFHSHFLCNCFSQTHFEIK